MAAKVITPTFANEAQSQQIRPSFYESMIAQYQSLHQSKIQLEERLTIFKQIVDAHDKSEDVKKVFDLLTKLQP